jgi:hypothetical protein
MSQPNSETNRAMRWLLPLAFLLFLGVIALGVAYKYRKTIKAWAGMSPPPAVLTAEEELAKHWEQREVGPRLYKATPENAASNVPVTTRIELTFDNTVAGFESDSFDPTRVSSQNIGLMRGLDNSYVAGDVAVSADGKTISFTPAAPLMPGENYVIYAGNGLKSQLGKDVHGLQQTFFTAPSEDLSGIAFEKVESEKVLKATYTALVWGPDEKLYGATVDGRIIRYTKNPDGTLGTPEPLPGVSEKHGQRIITGILFDKLATKDNLVAYVTHTPMMFFKVPDFTAMLSKLSGDKLQQVDEVLINLPRSFLDHQTFAPVYGADGAIYFHQGASNAYGDPDPIWGNRPEHLLTASVLRLDISKWDGQPLDTKTIDNGGPYDPSKPGAILTVYATGIRVAYNLLFHSNGKLYAAINGSSAGGNVPAGPNTPAIPSLDYTEHDWLFTITKGSYHGHPNPSQKHFVLNGGNPTVGLDPQEITDYPVGTKPDPAWVPATMSFGRNISANGMLEYKSEAFGGKLKNMIVVCRWNVGSDLIFLGLNDQGRVSRVYTKLPGTFDLSQPLAVLEDPATGNLYVSESSPKASRITLLRVRK